MSKQKNIKSYGIREVVWVILLSLLAFPVCHLLNHSTSMSNQTYIFLAGIIIAFISIPPITHVMLPRSQSIYFYVFSVFAFTAMVDLALGFTINGLTDMVDFYLKEGEVYLDTSHGMLINYWDGVVHYGCYLILAFCLATERSHRLVGYFWTGSILNSLVVFLPGNIIGKYGPELKLSYLLNIPYAVFPVTFLLRLIFSSSTESDLNNGRAKKRGIVGRLIDWILIAVCLVVIGFLAFRCIVVFNPQIEIFQKYYQIEPYLADPTRYPELQMISNALYFVPFYLYVIGSIMHRDINGGYISRNVLESAVFFVGAAAQGQFAYIGGSLLNIDRNPEPSWREISPEYLGYFWSVNIAFLAIPILIAFWAVINGRGNSKQKVNPQARDVVEEKKGIEKLDIKKNNNINVNVSESKKKKKSKAKAN